MRRTSISLAAILLCASAARGAYSPATTNGWLVTAGRVAGADHEDWRRYRDRAERYQAAYEELETTLDRVERVAQRGRFGRNGYQIQHIITAGRARARRRFSAPRPG